MREILDWNISIVTDWGDGEGGATRRFWETLAIATEPVRPG